LHRLRSPGNRHSRFANNKIGRKVDSLGRTASRVAQAVVTPVRCGTIVGTPTNLVSSRSIGAVLRQNKRPGRWVLRAAFVIGVGAAVLGGPIAAGAATVPAIGGALHAVSANLGLSGISVVQSGDTVNTTDDLIWT
jgi:hypothetical protein